MHRPGGQDGNKRVGVGDKQRRSCKNSDQGDGQDLAKKETDIRPEHTLIEDLEMDSFYAVELLFELEDQYGIEIPDEEAENFKKVQDIIEYIENRLEPN